MTSVDLIVIELCCGRSSELSQATKRLNAIYVGVHDHLESPSLRQQVLRALMTAGTGRKRCLIHCHVSLPCTGGSPLLNFSKPGVREHHQVKFLNLLSSLGGYLSGIKRLDPKALITFELPHQNQYWRLDMVRNFREKWKLLYHGVAAGCRTGLCTSQRIPIGKRYRIVSENQEVAQCVHQRFSECHCSCEHAAFNEIDWRETERYTKRFAMFLVRTAFRVRESLG